jgi:hypothetical protein
MTRKRHKLGDHAYLFVDVVNKNNSCIIDAHGRVDFGVCDPLWTTPKSGPSLRFLVREGETLKTDIDLTRRFLEELDGYDIVETVKPGQPTWDYVLTKFQAGSAPSSNRMQEYTYDFLEKGEGVDVVTIRNRNKGDHTGAMLSWVLNELDKAGRHYKHVYCKFCRAQLLGSSGTPKMLPGTRSSTYADAKP